MKRILFFFVAGIVTASLAYRLVAAPDTDLTRCIHMFSNNPEISVNNPEMKKVMEHEGVNSVNELIVKRCTYWIKNGQTF